MGSVGGELSPPGPPGYALRPLPPTIGGDGTGGQGGREPFDDEEFHRIWREATPESIGRDVERMKGLLDAAVPEHRPLLAYWLEALEVLEYWLRDR